MKTNIVTLDDIKEQEQILESAQQNRQSQQDLDRAGEMLRRIYENNNGSDAVEPTNHTVPNTTVIDPLPVQEQPPTIIQTIQTAQDHFADLNRISREMRRVAQNNIETPPVNNTETGIRIAVDNMEHVRESLHNIQTTTNNIINNQQQQEVILTGVQQQFSLLRAASSRLVNEYTTFLIQNPFTGLLASTVTFGGIFLLIRNSTGVFTLFRRTAQAVPLVLPSVSPNMAVRSNDIVGITISNINVDNVSRVGGIAYIIRLVGRFLRHL